MPSEPVQPLGEAFGELPDLGSLGAADVPAASGAPGPGQSENLGSEAVEHARSQLGAVATAVLKELQHVASVQSGTPASLVGRLVDEGRVTVVQDGEPRPHGRGASAVGGQYQTATRRVGTAEQAYGSGAPGRPAAAQRRPEPLAGLFAGEREVLSPTSPAWSVASAFIGYSSTALIPARPSAFCRRQ
nr:hypothetical protein [Streptomyces olivaceus]